ncbi:hypothetical protein Tco_1361294 [Tanacetum coccineum]
MTITIPLVDCDTCHTQNPHGGVNIMPGYPVDYISVEPLTFGSYFAAFVLVVDAVYFLSVLPTLRYSRSLLKKKSAGTVRRPQDSGKGRGLLRS